MPDERLSILQQRLRPTKASIIDRGRQRALELKARLDANPALKQADLARELDVSRARITQMLRALET